MYLKEVLKVKCQSIGLVETTSVRARRGTKMCLLVLYIAMKST